MTQPKSEFSRPLALSDLSGVPNGAPLPFSFNATAAECEALAKRLGVASVQTMRVEGHATPALGPVSGDAAMRIVATVTARISQICMVTLEPFDSEISEPFEVLCANDLEEPDWEQDIDIESLLEMDDVEQLVNGTVDLGELATQFLSLGVDPHPRKPGVELPSSYFSDEPVTTDGLNPFAELAKLKQKH